MRKKLFALLLVAVVLCCCSVTVLAAGNEVSIVIDGAAVPFGAAAGTPFVDENGRTQVPLRVVMEQYGCSVHWDAATKTAYLNKGENTVVVPIGEKHILVNGQSKAMDTAALVKDGRTYLPIRPVLEAFGAKVDWQNGKVSVSSPEQAAFENIYVDADGNLIFALANGSKLNLGSASELAGEDGKDGADGKDGVSVIDAYVDGAGNLMIKLSNGRSINAGNIGTGGSMSNLTFADYPLGTKFYLTEPRGAFTVLAKAGNGQSYTVSFDEVYYELAAKHDWSSEEAWTYTEDKLITTKYISRYRPYQTKLVISGKADPALAGYNLSIGLYSVGGESASFGYPGMIQADGSFSIGEDLITNWYAPKTLYFYELDVIEQEEADEPLSEEECIALVVGEWAASPDEKVTVLADGTLIHNGTSYKPSYEETKGGIEAYPISGNKYCSFYLEDMREDQEERMYFSLTGEYYYRGRSWESVAITKENFLDYYELKEEVEIEYDPFGVFEGAEIIYTYVLKAGYEERLDVGISEVTVKTSYDCYQMDYEINLANKSYSVTEPGEFRWSGEAVMAGDRQDRVLCLEELRSSYINAEKGNKYFLRNFQIVDAMGTLYFLND